MRALGLTAFFFLTPMPTVNGESPRSFEISARFFFGSRTSAMKSKIFRLSTVAYTSVWPWFQTIRNGGPPKRSRRAARCKWRHQKGRDKGRVTKLCCLATCQSGSCQLPLQLSLYLEGADKTFHCTSCDVSFAVIKSSRRMTYYFSRNRVG